LGSYVLPASKQGAQYFGSALRKERDAQSGDERLKYLQKTRHAVSNRYFSLMSVKLRQAFSLTFLEVQRNDLHSRSDVSPLNRFHQFLVLLVNTATDVGALSNRGLRCIGGLQSSAHNVWLSYTK